MKPSMLMPILAVGSLLGGCAAAVPVIDFYDADSETLRHFAAIDVVDETDIEQGDYRDLGPVKGLYCSRDRVGLILHDPRARRQVIDQVKLKAAELGAHAISEPRCVQSRKTDLSNNCWGTIVCEASAWRDDYGQSAGRRGD